MWWRFESPLCPGTQLPIRAQAKLEEVEQRRREHLEMAVVFVCCYTGQWFMFNDFVFHFKAVPWTGLMASKVILFHVSISTADIYRIIVYQHSKSIHHVLRPIHKKTSRNYEQAQEVFGKRYQNLHRSMHPTRTSPIHRLSGANVFLMAWLPNTTGRLGWSMLQLCGEIHRGNLGSSGFGPWW